MFKGIIAAREQQLASQPEVTGEDVLQMHAYMEALADGYESERAFEQQQETLKNARALRTALEQFGTDATATRALLAFADADGQLSAAFGTPRAAALESLSDDQVLSDAGQVKAGLESYILGEEEVSEEGIREVLDRKKKALASCGAVVGSALVVYNVAKSAIKVGASTHAFARAVSIGQYGGAALGFLLTAGALAVANKIVNKNRTVGTEAEFEENLKVAEAAARVLAIATKVHSAADLSSLASKVKADAEAAGIDVASEGTDASMGDKKIPPMKMTLWAESGWTPEKVKSAAAEHKKFLMNAAIIIRDAEKSVAAENTESNAYHEVDEQLNLVDDLIYCASHVLRERTNATTRQLESAARFLVPEKEAEPDKE